MELTQRQKKLLAAAARKIARGDLGKYRTPEDARPYFEAIGPIIRDAIDEAAPEIGKAEAGNRIAPAAVYLAGVYVEQRVREAMREHQISPAGVYAGRQAKEKAEAQAKTKAARAKAPKAETKVKAGTELDLMKQAAAKAKAKPKAKPAPKKAAAPKTKAVLLPGKNGGVAIVCVPKQAKGVIKVCRKAKKTAKAAVLLIAAALIFSAGIAAAQCPGGNCSRGTGAGYYYPAWGGWYWPGYYYGYGYTQARGNCPGGNCARSQEQPAAEPEETPADPEPENIPEWKPVEPAPEEAEPAPEAEPETIELPPCPMAALAIRAVNDARRARGLTELIPDENLSAACARHSALMKARGFGHAPDGGRECIAENYATPAATVSAWLNSPAHAAIILGAGTRIGIGVVGKFYTLRIR